MEEKVELGGEEMEIPVVAGRRRIGLVGCVKGKASSPRPAKDLYVSPLFKGRRAYVERTCDEWWILSALHGLVDPDNVVAPYDLAMGDLGRSDRRVWSEAVLCDIDQRIHPAAGDTFELHAGTDYRFFGLEDGLRTRGMIVTNPTEGLRMGGQLAFYVSHS